MTRKVKILATAILCLFAFGSKVNALTVNFTTCNSYADHQCWPIGNKVNPINSTVPITIGITDGSFHHYNAYLRRVSNLEVNIATLVTDATSSAGITYNWYANTADTYRVCIVVYDAYGNELANTKNNSNYNFEVKSISVSTGNASSITSNSAILSGGSNTTGYGCTGIAYRVYGSGTWNFKSSTVGNGTVSVTGLSPCTTYQFYYWADFCTGMFSGTVETFTTLSNLSQPGTISGPTSVCAGGGQQNYYISQVSGATSYTWSYPSGWTLTGYYYSGSDWDVYLTPGSSAQSGYVRVKANNSCGSSSESSLYVTVNAPPTAPTSISGAGTTICSGGSITLTASGGSAGSGCTYQWYSGGCGSGSVLGTGSSITVSPTSNTTYYVRRVGTSPCNTTTTACASGTITVNTAPTAPTSITGTTTICSGSSTTLTASGGNTGSGCTYQWYSGGCGSGSVLGTGSSITVNPTSNTTYYVRRVGTSPCNTTTTACASVTVTVNSVPPQPGTISGTTPVCAGSGARTYSISAVSGATSYTWSLPSGWSGSSTTTSISATPGLSAQSGTISVTANNSCGSSTARTYSITVNSVPSQPGAISGTSPVCAGSGARTYSISAVSGATSYTWSLPSGWSGSSTTTSISATPGSSAQSGTISVTANNSCGSSTARTYSVTVNSVPSQPGTISGTSPVCAGSGAQTYSISAVSGATSYTWSLPSGWSGSSTSTSISAIPGSSAQSGTISVTANNSCGSSTARTYSVTVNSVPSQPGAISGTTSVCAGSGAQTYSISAVSGATSYTWSLPGGWTGSSTSTSISATPGSSAQIGYIRVTANNSCGSSPERTLYITANAAPSQPGTISGPTYVDAGSGAKTYSISAISGATGYTWSVPLGWIIISGQNTTGISATPGSSAQSGNISVTANNGCGSSSARTLYVIVNTPTPPPSQPGAISGTTSVCAGSGAQTYSISSVSGATSYTWTLPSGWSGSSTGTSISATPGSSAQSGNISVMANNSSGSSPARTLYITVNTVPSQPGTISGSTSVEAGSGAKTYSISSVSGATSYIWSLPGGWSGSSTTASISATPGSSAQSGYIRVTANNGCGSSSERTLYVTVTPIPPPNQPGAITGPTSVCAGSGAQTYSISSVSGATSYTWFLPSGWSGSSTGTSISATPGSNAQSGDIRVTANNAYGSSSARTLSITVNTVPSQPGTISGSTSVEAGSGVKTYSISAISGATSYTWSLPSGWSGSSTTTSISATPGSSAQSGYIRVTANNGCGSSSERTLYVTTTIPSPNQPGAITGPTSVCAGSGAQTYSISSVSGATSYTWSLPSGWSGSSTGTSISATSGSSAQSGNISVTANNSSGSSPARTLYITVNPVPSQPGAISGSTSVSAGGGTQTYSISSVSGATSYTWTLPNGWTGSSTTTSISSTPGSNAQSGYIRVKANNSCGSSSESTLYVTIIVSTCEVQPLLTTYWAQRAPYNNLVNSKLHQYYPEGSSYDYPTGCVATAMAQIMNYWEHPYQRTKRIPEYTTSGKESFPHKIPVSAVEGTTTYNWSNMLNLYNSSATNTAVETLMYECGVSVHMNYTPGGSGADGLYTSEIGVAAVLPNYFRYDNGTKIEERSDYTSATWNAMLREELNAGRPIYYVGYDCAVEPCAGHAFVCDGYRNCNNENLFHINWGWGTGYNDVWVVTSVLPVSSYQFDTWQRVVTHIKPSTDAYIDPTNADNVNTFAISANALPGGYIIPTGTAIIYSGENKPLVFAADYGYEIDQVFIDGTPDATAKANGYYIFQNVTSNHSIIVTFKVSPTGIKDIHTQNISIYPNPAKDEIFIKSDLQIEKVEICSLTGILLLSENNFTEKISVSALLRGVYLLKVHTDKGLVVSKIVKE